MSDAPGGPAEESPDLALSRAANYASSATDGRRIARELGQLLAPVFAGGQTGAEGGQAGVPPVEVADIGANPIDGDPPYRLLLDAGLCRVTGFEPQAAALADLRVLAGPQERYLPYAVGNGGVHTLRLCATSGFASLLEPDENQLALLVDFPELAAVVGREAIATQRLDDLDEITRIDLLKIDIQGGELAVFQAGRQKLATTVAVQTEVGFHRLYRDQPMFADVDLELRKQGFVPHQFVTTRTWPLAPVGWRDPLERASRQLVEADVLYVRDLSRFGDLDDAQLGRLALICDVVYGAFGVTLRCVLELIHRGALAESAEASYRALAGSRMPA